MHIFLAVFQKLHSRLPSSAIEQQRQTIAGFLPESVAWLETGWRAVEVQSSFGMQLLHSWSVCKGKGINSVVGGLRVFPQRHDKFCDLSLSWTSAGAAEVHKCSKRNKFPWLRVAWEADGQSEVFLINWVYPGWLWHIIPVLLFGAGQKFKSSSGLSDLYHTFQQSQQKRYRKQRLWQKEFNDERGEQNCSLLQNLLALARV